MHAKALQKPKSETKSRRIDAAVKFLKEHKAKEDTNIYPRMGLDRYAYMSERVHVHSHTFLIHLYIGLTTQWCRLMEYCQPVQIPVADTNSLSL